jgi:hypothetical protein
MRQPVPIPVLRSTGTSSIDSVSMCVRGSSSTRAPSSVKFIYEYPSPVGQLGPASR